eukprot:g373.t1
MLVFVLSCARAIVHVPVPPLCQNSTVSILSPREAEAVHPNADGAVFLNLGLPSACFEAEVMDGTSEWWDRSAFTSSRVCINHTQVDQGANGRSTLICGTLPTVLRVDVASGLAVLNSLQLQQLAIGWHHLQITLTVRRPQYERASAELENNAREAAAFAAAAHGNIPEVNELIGAMAAEVRSTTEWTAVSAVRRFQVVPPLPLEDKPPANDGETAAAAIAAAAAAAHKVEVLERTIQRHESLLQRQSAAIMQLQQRILALGEGEGTTGAQRGELSASTRLAAAAAAAEARANSGGELRLNLGCGSRKLPGFINIDADASVSPDMVLDLDRVPKWPFNSSSVARVELRHVLEHLGPTPEALGHIMRELHRVCLPDARVHITLPHPHHLAFWQDPTHVRPIVLETFDMFSRKKNEAWRKAGASHTPLALVHGVDFEMVHSRLSVDQGTVSDLVRAGAMAPEDSRNLTAVYRLSRIYMSLISEVFVELRVIK